MQCILLFFQHLYTSSPFSEPISLEMREVGPEEIPKRPEMRDVNLPGSNSGSNGAINDHVSVRSSATPPGLLWLVGPVIAAILLTAALILLFVVKK